MSEFTDGAAPTEGPVPAELYASEGGAWAGSPEPEGAPSLSISLEEAAEQLGRREAFWGAALGDAATVTYAFREKANTMPSGTSGFSQYNPDQMAAAEWALLAWTDVARLDFDRVGEGTFGSKAYSNDATVLFGNYASGAEGAAAFAYFPDNKNRAASSFEGDVWTNSSQADNWSPAMGNYGQLTLTHEIGHALGLSHPGDYNAGPGQEITYEANAYYIEDTRQYSVMSYFSETHTGADFAGQFGAAPMMHDIAAIQRYYGANATAFAGDDVYGFGRATGADYRPWYDAAVMAQIYCVWDTGGEDTLDYSGYAAAQLIDLQTGPDHFSNVGGLVGNVSIYVGVVIENAVGGSGADRLLGNAAANVLTGGDGADTLEGGDGADSLVGGGGVDSLVGGAGADTLAGGIGDETYTVEAGDTVVELAGEGLDTVMTLGDFTLGAEVENLTLLSAAGSAGTGNGAANLIIGGAGADTLLGAGGSDTLNGMGGADVLDGGAAGDRYIVGDAVDTVSDSGADGLDRVVTSLKTHVLGAGIEELEFAGAGAFKGTGNGLANLLIGGNKGDLLDGKAGADTLFGGRGDDAYVVDSVSDKVTEKGGAGFDTVRTALTVFTLGDNLEGLAFTGAGAFAGTGNALANSLTGGAGNDTLDGLAGADTLKGGKGDDVYRVDADTDLVVEAAGEGRDRAETTLATYVLGDNIEDAAYVGPSVGIVRLTGNVLNNRLTGGTEYDDLDGGAGDDTMVGGSGNDAYHVDLAGDRIVEAADGAGVDTVWTAISYVLGDSLEDLRLEGEADLTGAGNALGNGVYGNAGDNYLRGLGGVDDVRGGDGDDTVDGGAGVDTLYGNYGADTYLVDQTADVAEDLSYDPNRDQVRSTATQYTLSQYIEDLHFIGTGNALMTGNAAGNLVSGGNGADTLRGMDGTDTLFGGGGADWLEGGSGIDTASYAGATRELTIDLAGGATRGAAAGDRFSGIETYELTGFADNMMGSTATESIFGGAGDDTLGGLSGADTLDGGDGIDTASYLAAAAYVAVDITGAGDAGEAADDTLISIERYLLSGWDDRFYGGADGDHASGAGGRDWMNGAGGADSLFGGAGDDTLMGHAGADALNGGDGFDLATYYLSPTPVSLNLRTGVHTGEAEGDTFAGVEAFVLTGGADTLTAGAGAVWAKGRDGDDRLTGGDGADTLEGGAGADRLDGGAGLDLVSYYAAASAVKVDLLADVGTWNDAAGDTYRLIEGAILGGGSDTFLGDAGANFASGGIGHDTLQGAKGDDTLIGGEGSDRLEGGEGIDTADYRDSLTGVTLLQGSGGVSGGAAGDTLVSIERYLLTGSTDSVSGTGAGETILGFAGSDTIDGGGGADRMDGGEGVDILSFQLATAGVGLDLASGALTGAAAGGSFSNFERYILSGFNDTAIGAGGADVVEGRGGNDLLRGGAGDDILIGGEGNDTLVGGAGADNLNGAASTGIDLADYRTASGPITMNFVTGVMTGEVANDTFNGIEAWGLTEFADSVVFAPTGHYRAYGYGGADTLTGSEAQETLDGGAGADRIDGGAGDDTVSYGTAAAGMSLNLTTGAGTGDAKGDVLVSIELLELSGWDDTLVGSAAADSVMGGAGGDLMLGEGGADFLQGGDGDDTLEGGAGGDYLLGDGGFDTVTYARATSAATILLGFGGGNSGAALGDVLQAERFVLTAYADQFTGRDGVLAVEGGAGNDILKSGGGATSLYGGRGDDTLYGDAVGADLYDGGAGSDGLTYLNTTAAVGIDLVTGIHTGQAAGSAIVAVEKFILSNVGDTFVGDDDAQVVGGMQGADRLSGGGGADSLEGGEGDDTIDGGAGVDSLNGGTGVDTLTYASSGKAVGIDLTTGVHTGAAAGETIQLGSFDEFILTAGADSFKAGTFNVAETVKGGEGDDLINALGQSDQLFGQRGNDTLIGGLGADTLEGGQGDDVFVFREFSESSTAQFDRITDLKDNADVIDLSLVDANENVTGDQAFTVVSAFTNQAGQAVLSFDGTDTRLEGDINGDGFDDFVLIIAGQHTDPLGAYWVW